MHPWYQVEIGFRLQKYVFFVWKRDPLQFLLTENNLRKFLFFAISVSKFVTTSKLSKPFLIKIITKPEKIDVLYKPNRHFKLLRYFTASCKLLEQCDVINGRPLTHADRVRNEFLFSLWNIITPKLPIGLFTSSACRCQLPAGHVLNECKLERVRNPFNPLFLHPSTECIRGLD